MSDTDDIWGDDGSLSENNVDYDRAIAEREWARMHENFGNEGYREGIEEGKDDQTLQQGFNRGWKDGFRYGHELGRLRGLISPLVEFVESQPAGAGHKQIHIPNQEQWIKDAKAMLSDLAAIGIENMYDKDYFDDRKPGPVPLASSPTAQEGTSNKTSCCKSSDGDGDAQCCSNATNKASTTGDCQSKASANGDSSSGCCKSKSSSRHAAATASSSAMADTTPEGSEYSKPEAVVKAFRDRAIYLLQQANLAHLVTVRD
ncbi:hypothetical protein BGW42_006758 [Actinomortierella wolfii]|nr:hypothetical protein BGW42_006758 [Actinomortierella wolfii]